MHGCSGADVAVLLLCCGAEITALIFLGVSWVMCISPVGCALAGHASHAMCATSCQRRLRHRLCTSCAQAASLQVSTAGANIRGVVLCQELPHLSHLGVRSRQECVPLATCTSQAAIGSTIKPLLGKSVKLKVGSEGVSIAAHDGAPAASESMTAGEAVPAASPQHNGASSISRVSSVEVIPMSDATLKNGGAKAQVCGALASLADGLFKVPAGTVLPFGCLEAAVAGAGASAEFEGLLQELETAKVGEELDASCMKVQALIQERCKPSTDVAAKAVEKMAGTGIAIARSSANVEDLAGLSGAGLYDSIPNLKVSDAEAVAAGIAEVWASLYSRRAVLSRRTAGIKQSDACMAVLVQVCDQTDVIQRVLPLVCLGCTWFL